MAIETSALAHLRLWQLISPTLPVGAYAYSQGLEYAIHSQWLRNENDLYDWLSGLILHTQVHLDIPVLKRLYLAWSDSDEKSIQQWSDYILAARESSEIRAEDLHLGQSLARLLSDIGITAASEYRSSDRAAFVVLLALAAVHWQISVTMIAQGYLWSWCENQVAAAIKLFPLGQTAGQRVLLKLAELIPAAVDTGLSLSDDDIGMLAPAVGIASARHETQYCRLFRS